jgi:hypothetical protein
LQATHAPVEPLHIGVFGFAARHCESFVQATQVPLALQIGWFALRATQSASPPAVDPPAVWHEMHSPEVAPEVLQIDRSARAHCDEVVQAVQRRVEVLQISLAVLPLFRQPVSVVQPQWPLVHWKPTEMFVHEAAELQSQTPVPVLQFGVAPPLSDAHCVSAVQPTQAEPVTPGLLQIGVLVVSDVSHVAALAQPQPPVERHEGEAPVQTDGFTEQLAQVPLLQ